MVDENASHSCSFNFFLMFFLIMYITCTIITGRVARAGRSGTAYSFVSSDEVPYMIDLHLFLGRSLATSGKDGLYFIHVYMCIFILYSVHITTLLDSYIHV